MCICDPPANCPLDKSLDKRSESQYWSDCSLRIYVIYEHVCPRCTSFDGLVTKNRIRAFFAIYVLWVLFSWEPATALLLHFCLSVSIWCIESMCLREVGGFHTQPQCLLNLLTWESSSLTCSRPGQKGFARSYSPLHSAILNSKH